MAEDTNPSIGKKVMIGGIWTFAMRWFIRLIGFISSALLARLLVPEDFGLVAMALVLGGLANVLFEFGVEWALIQNNKADDDDFNAA